jgi:pimeloyl-ACP methyl ester carboxylesterase
MYFTGRHAMAGDLAAGVREVEKLEGERKASGQDERVGVVLVAHSAGGALAQYALSRSLIKVHAFCLFAGVPGFGS